MTSWKNEGAIIQVKWKSGTPKDAWKTWTKSPLVKSGWATTGEWDCQIWVNAKNPADAHKFVWENIRNNKHVEATETCWGWQWL